EQLGFDDFRRNGLLLPANDTATLRMGLPLHRGPHRLYNEMVIERVGEVERFWSDQRLQAPEIALEIALMRLSLLQRALRRRLLEPGSKALRLNRRDPVGFGYDFTELDAMADQIWAATDDPFTQG
ncbi:MAG: AHH domain-containing protein, partial [Sphingomonadaceae bacterium]